MTWVLAVVLAAVLVVALLVWWAGLEARSERERLPAYPSAAARPGRAPDGRPRLVLPPGPEGHVQFARGLAEVSAAYLALCEDRADERMGT